jgi:alkylmercury lyase
MLKHTAHIESLDPISGDKIRVSVTADGVQKVEPESAVVSWVNSSVDPSNIRGSVCHYVYFFSSSETASKWIAEHPGKMFYPVVDAFRAAKKIHNKHSEMRADVCC